MDKLDSFKVDETIALRLEPQSPSDRVLGYLGSALEERNSKLLVTWFFDESADSRTDVVRCVLRTDDPIEHTYSIGLDHPHTPPKIIRNTPTETQVAALYENFPEITWYRKISVSCSARFESGERAFSETGYFNWTSPPRIGSEGHAFGVGPYFDDFNTYHLDECRAQVHNAAEGAQMQTICYPPHEIENATIWQNETSLFLRSNTRSTPAEEAILSWFHPTDDEGVVMTQASMEYIYKTGEAIYGEDRLDVDVNGNSTTLIVPLDLIKNRTSNNYLPFSLHLRAYIQNEGVAYLAGYHLPPYRLS